MELTIDYQPTAKQVLFHTSTANEVLYGGAAGGGKSKAIVMDGLARCLTYPGTSAYMFRRTYSELEDTLIKEAKASYPPGLAKYNSSRHEMLLPNGSLICFRHCASPADMYLYAGAEIQWLYIDELTSFEYEIYTFLKTRLRAKKALGVKPLVRCASNPGNIGHSWVKSMFVDAAPPLTMVNHVERLPGAKHSRQFTTQYIPALATDNPHITDDYLYELNRKPKALRDALLYGKWDAFEGQVFLEFTDDPEHYDDRIGTHVIRPFEIPSTWRRYFSFDHGYSAPFSCAWWACDPEGRLYRYREWYGSDGTPNHGLFLSPREIAQGILDREEDERRNNIFIDRVADPAIFDKSRGDSVADMMRNIDGGHARGVMFRKGDNNRIAGKMQVHERLRFDETGRPKLYVFNTCRDFIRTVPTLPYDRIRTEDVDSKAEDHAYDDTRYMCMARPLPTKGMPVRPPQPYDPFE